MRERLTPANEQVLSPIHPHNLLRGILKQNKAARLGLVFVTAFLSTACVDGRNNSDSQIPQVPLSLLKNSPHLQDEVVTSTYRYINRTHGFSFLVPSNYEYDQKPGYSDDNFRFLRLYQGFKEVVLTGQLHPNTYKSLAKWYEKTNTPKLTNTVLIRTSLNTYEALLLVANRSPYEYCGNPDTFGLTDITTVFIDLKDFVLQLKHQYPCLEYRNGVNRFAGILETFGSAP